MNKIFKLRFNKKSRSWVAVSELCKHTGKSKRPRLHHPLLKIIAAIACFLPLISEAAPTGAQIISGNVTINQIGTTTQITNTPNAIIQWGNFSISANEIVNFIQQHSASAVLNNISGQNPSEILGQILSNGKVYLINPNGIVFGANSKVDTAGFLASTLNISDANFLAGKDIFEKNPNTPNTSIAIHGVIQTSNGGNIAILSDQVSVEKTGVIKTQGGNIILAAGQTINLVDMSNPKLSIVVSAPNSQSINLGTIINPDGKTMMGHLVQQSGLIDANSLSKNNQGEIVLKADHTVQIDTGSITSANGSANSQGGSIEITAGEQINLDGTIQAKGGSTQGDGGNITASSKNITLSKNTILNTSATKSGQGGNLTISGTENVDINGGSIESNGGSSVGNGGNINISGKKTTIKENTTIKANAQKSGNGGKISITGDKQATIAGIIEAQSGKQAGNGGTVETSGEILDINQAKINITTQNKKGNKGTWIISSSDITIKDKIDYANPATSYISSSVINNQLSSVNNVHIKTDSKYSTSTHDITLDQASISSQNSNFTLQSAGNLTMKKSSIAMYDVGDVNFWVNGKAELYDSVINTVNGDFKLAGFSGDDTTSPTNFLVRNSSINTRITNAQVKKNMANRKKAEEQQEETPEEKAKKTQKSKSSTANSSQNKPQESNNSDSKSSDKPITPNNSDKDKAPQPGEDSKPKQAETAEQPAAPEHDLPPI